MIKFMILFQKPVALDTFEMAYNDLLALIERMPHITRRQVIDVLGSPVGAPRYYRILEVYYNDQTQMEESLRSKAGQEAGSELSRRFIPGKFETMFAEVYEEAGGSTGSG
jgi:hypothetical protein